MRHALAALGLVLILPLIGCNPARQDRSITFSKEGATVAFQHDGEGVFVAGKDGGPPVKVFEPGPDVAAVSTPLWSPKDERLIFTTAKAIDGGNLQPRSSLWFGGQDPAGALFAQRAVTYTCWLRDKADSKPVPLFEAVCDHIGYVAGNLAVRWHPGGDRILYVGQTENQHTVFEFDLKSKQSRLSCPHAGRAVILDWAPNGKHLICVLSGIAREEDNGVWIGQPDANDWRHLEGSQHLAHASPDSLLERLKASRPVWTRDGMRFACVSTHPKTGSKGRDQHILRIGTLEGEHLRAITESNEPFRDLHWSPDGKRLGFVRGADPGRLSLIAEDGQLSSPATLPVRHFAGWSADGKNLAYTTADNLPYASDKLWAFLLLPDPLARDAVHIAAGSGADVAKEVFSGMRVTFPAWSPREDKLSLWFTFSPTHRFLLSALFGLGMRRGDPAAVFDVHSGHIGWMAVTSHEKSHIGHYHLLKGQYAAALARYQEAARELPPPQQPTVGEFVRNLQSPRNLTFFEYYCLKKLGRREEAEAKLALFHKTFLPKLTGDDKDGMFHWLGERRQLWLALLKDFYAAEVFLSLDAAPDARRYFEQRLKATKVEASRLSCALVLGQIFLLENKRAEYAELTTATILPLLLKTWQAAPALPNGQGFLGNSRSDLLLLGALALAPLQSAEFLAGLPDTAVEAAVPRWRGLREQANDDTPRFGIDLILLAANERLGRHQERRLIWDRVQANPVRRELLPKEDGFKDPAVLLRGLLRNIGK